MKRLIPLALILSFFATDMLARYKGKYADFIKGPAFHLMTKAEVKAFKKLKSDSDAEDFIALFWAKRDPTPDTAANEFKDRFDLRVSIADKDFDSDRLRGAMTDRGKIFIILGAATARKVSDYQGATGSTDDIGVTSEGTGGGKYGKAFLHGVMELWLYRKDRLPDCIQQHEIMFKFLKEEKAKVFTMDRNNAQTLQSIDAAKDCVILHPDLKTAPIHAKAFIAGPTEQMKYTVALARGESAPMKESAILETAPFFSDHETRFLALQIYIPESKIGGELDPQHMAILVMDESDNPIVKFDEDVPLKSTPGGHYVDRSIILLPGTYKLALSLGPADGAPLFADVSEQVIPEFSDEMERPLWFALSTDIKPMPEAQYATDPYAFGGVKVVPKSDNIFTVNQDLWVFANIFYPSLQEDGTPKLYMRLEFLKEGKRIKKTADMKVQPTLLNEGRYAFGQAYNIGSELKLEPGTYTIKVHVKNKTDDKKWEREREFTVIE